MAIKRVLAIGLVGAALAGSILALFPGIPRGLIFMTYVVFESMFPSTISWDAKNAYVKCEGAIASPAQWPKLPAEACAAMHMCANEAPLSDRQDKLLSEAVRKTPGCPEL